MTLTHTLGNAKRLRAAQTDAESRLWYYLRGKRFAGVKFKRQKPLGRYIADFVAVERRLVIELDGSQHLENQAYDNIRSQYLAAAGYRVLRFWNNDVLTDTASVLAAIEAALSPGPSPASGRGEALR